MNVNQLNQLRNKGLVHVPSGEIYEFKPFEQLVSKPCNTEQIIGYLDKLYPLSFNNGIDDFHKFLWEAASSTERAVRIEIDQLTGNYSQDIWPTFDWSEFEVI